jgi:Putative auto-transporter adhesin, head GIN domain
LLIVLKEKLSDMKRILFSVFAFLISITAFSQDTKNVVYDANAEIRKVDDFTAIEVSNAITVYISQGKENAVVISADDNAAKEKIKTIVRNGVLKINMESGLWNKWSLSDKKVKAYVTVKTLEKLVVNGASSAKIVDKLNAAVLKITVSGASNLKGDISANDLHLELSGASTATINGTADNLNIVASSASNLKGFDLVAKSCSAEASGASSIKINVTDEFSKVHASGASSIHYRGNASVKDFEASGASSIKKDSGK